MNEWGHNTVMSLEKERTGTRLFVAVGSSVVVAVRGCSERPDSQLEPQRLEMDVERGSLRRGHQKRGRWSREGSIGSGGP